MKKPMSKYDPLWAYIQAQSGQTLLLSFAEIETICGLPIDHSFLKYKKELADYGWQVEKISMKQQTIRFRKAVLSISIRELEQEELAKALCLVWRVFQKYEALDYTKEGVEEFYKSIHDENYLSGLCLYGAFAQEELVGVIATRCEGTHIALFFVDEKYHRQGIGKRLFQTVRAQCPFDRITVNSSPYAIPVYHRLGFHDTDIEQVVNGLRFTPMEIN